MPHVLIRARITPQVFSSGITKSRKMHYRNQQFEDFYTGWERENYDNTWADIVRVSVEKLGRCAIHLFLVRRTAGAFPLCRFSSATAKCVCSLLLSCLSRVGVFAVIWSNAHYAAPLTLHHLCARGTNHSPPAHDAHRPSSRGPGIVPRHRAPARPRHRDQRISWYLRPLLWPCQGDPSRTAIAEKLRTRPANTSSWSATIKTITTFTMNGFTMAPKSIAPNSSGPANSILNKTQALRLFQRSQNLARHPDSDNTYLEPYTPPGVARQSDE